MIRDSRLTEPGELLAREKCGLGWGICVEEIDCFHYRKVQQRIWQVIHTLTSKSDPQPPGF